MKRTKWIHVWAAGCLLALAGCQDDSLDAFMPAMPDTGTTRALEAVNPDSNTGGLVPYTDGSKIVWKAIQRVPLTGIGRTIGNMSPGLVTVIGGQNNFNALLDNNLENAASLAGAVTANVAYNQVISVKDMYRTYAGGQKAGFVYSADTEVVNLDVLKMFSITLYKDGTLIETYPAVDESGLLTLDLLNLSNADGSQPQQVIAIDVPENVEFDEIALGCGGVEASVLGAMKLYYAFVGETPERTTVQGNLAFDANPYNASLYPDENYDPSWSNWADRSQLLNGDETDGPVIEVVGGALNWLGGGYRVTVDFGEEVPAGSEVGVRYTQGDVLAISVGSTARLYTYQNKPTHSLQEWEDYTEKYESGSLLGASLASGGKGANSFIANEDFRYLFFNVIGLNVKVGTTQYHYAYTRAKTVVDATAYFNIPERIKVHTDSYRFLEPAEGKVSFTLKEQVSGANASIIKEDYRVSGMTVEGEYVVEATYTAPDGRTFTQQCILERVNEDTQGDSGCNQFVTAENCGAKVVSPLDPTGGVLCLLCNAEDKGNLVDGNVNTYMGTMQAVDLIGNQSIVAVELDKPMPVAVDGYRAGFIMQVNNELLGLSALNFLYAKLYDENGNEIKSQVSGSRPTVDLGLLNQSSNKVRIGVKVPAGSKGFKRIELYNAGVLTLNLSSIRLYEVFYEPSNAENCSASGISEACMEMVTPASYGAQIDYNESKISTVVGLGNGMYSLDNVIDEDPKHETAATIPITNVIGETSLTVKFNTMPAGQTIGVILQSMEGIADVKLLSALKFEVYNGEQMVTDYESAYGEALNSGVLSLSLIGHEDKVYLEITPTSEFDRIRLSAASVANVLEQLLVYGVYTRVDANGDGIPDCLPDDDDPIAGGLQPRVNEVHLCEGDELSIPVWGGTEGDHTLTFKPYENELSSNGGEPIEVKMTLKGSNLTLAAGEVQPEPGVYRVDFGTGSSDYKNLLLVIHPKQTTWVGGTAGHETEWNLWTNWSAGTPWGCTDVVVPGALSHYPVLKAGNEQGYHCSRIQFTTELDAAGTPRIGEVVNTHYLTYDRAWVDVTLAAETYYMLSAPLKNTYTGDIFGTEAYDGVTSYANSGDYDYNNAWLVFDETSKPLDSDFRFTPRVYQHVFGGFTYNVTNDGTVALEPGDKNWTAPFNLVSQAYELGSGYLVKMGSGSETYDLRFPKLYPEYDYYTTDGVLIPGKTERVNRSTGAGERFIYEDATGQVTFPLHILLENGRPGDTWLVGNPFMAHLDLNTFFEGNVGVGSVTVLRENEYVTILRDGVSNISQIAPMEGFLITLRPPYSETNRYKTYVHFSEEMLQAGTAEGGSTRSIRQ